MTKAGPSIEITKEELYQLYWGTEGANKSTVAKKLGCDTTTLDRWLKFYNIPSKPRSMISCKPIKDDRLRNKEWLIKEFETKTRVQVAKELGVKVDLISYWAKKHDLLDSTKSETIKKSLKKKFPEGRKREKASNWKGGRNIVEGYVHISAPDHPCSKNGYAWEHRFVMERILGRCLEEDEIVHHLDGNRQNNDPSNLEVMKRGDHVSGHFQASHEVLALRKENEELRQELEKLKSKV